MVGDLEEIFGAAGRRWGYVAEVEFYPYADLKHTVRRKGRRVSMRLSDAFVDAPRGVLEALAEILLAKVVDRGRRPGEAWAIYRGYIATGEMERRRRELRRERARGGRERPRGHGRCYDLGEIFQHLNSRYFASALAIPGLAWSRRDARRVLGHWDETLDIITVSRVLDDDRLPSALLEYILYHEMLHMIHGTVRVNGRRRLHTEAFKADERRFEGYEEALEWARRMGGSTFLSGLG